MYIAILKAIRTGVGFGSGTETRTSPTFAYLGRISSVVRSPRIVPRPSGGGNEATGLSPDFDFSGYHFFLLVFLILC